MSGFLDNLLMRNLRQGNADDVLADHTPTPLRPRTPSLFEPHTAGANGMAMHDGTELESTEVGSAPRRQSDSQLASSDAQTMHPDRGRQPLAAPSRGASFEIGLERTDDSTAALESTDTLPPAAEATMTMANDEHKPTRRASLKDNHSNAERIRIGDAATLNARGHSTTIETQHLAPNVLSSLEVRRLAHDESHRTAEGPAPASSSAHAPDRLANSASREALAGALGPPLQTRASQSQSGSPARYRKFDGMRERSAEQPAPSIQVSIGRIEIRATDTGTSNTSSARKDRHTPQAISLDEYLQQRAGRGRE